MTTPRDDTEAAATPSDVTSLSTKRADDANGILTESVAVEEPTASTVTSEDTEEKEETMEADAEEQQEEEDETEKIQKQVDTEDQIFGAATSEDNHMGEMDTMAVLEAPDYEDEDDEFHEALEDGMDLLEDDGAILEKPTVPPTMSFSVNEMDVITNREGRTGSLSKFLDDADTFRRRSLPSYPDEQLFTSSMNQKPMTLTALLEMQIDPVLEILEDTDSDIRLWLMQPETVKQVLAAFVTPPVLSGEPHEEYGYYKKHFLCSEIIMKLYTGEEDLYESFSSDSSSGSTATTAVFGCQEHEDIRKWEQLYSIFENPVPLDEMQLLFFSKALVRLHDGFCLEEGYVSNVLKRFLPVVIPHLYSNTIKYMLTLILQSYESVHPITGRNDAMEIAAPLIAKATRVNPGSPENLLLVENTTNLLVDMLQANQADRLGAFSRREGGVYLSKYFVRDQFGTIRGFESMTHGYHNFLQYMLLEEMSKQLVIIEEMFQSALDELGVIRDKNLTEVSSALNIHVAGELLCLCQKFLNNSVEREDDGNRLAETEVQNTQMFGFSSFSSEQYPNSPHDATDTSMYNLASLPRGHALWTHVLDMARKTCGLFVEQFNKRLPPSVEISLAKYLNNLVLLNDAIVDEELHKGGLIQAYLFILENRSSFDMLIIHIVPAISFLLRDVDASRAKNCPLTRDLFGVDIDVPENIISLLLRAKVDIPSLDIYAAILHDVIDEVFTSKAPSQNNAQVVFHCKRNPAWAKLSEKTRLSTGSETSDSGRGSDERRSSASEQATNGEHGCVVDSVVEENGVSAMASTKEESVSCEDSEPATEHTSSVWNSVVNDKEGLAPELASTSIGSERADVIVGGPSTSSDTNEDVQEDPNTIPSTIALDAKETRTTSNEGAASPEEATKEKADTSTNNEGDGSRKSHYFKNVLQSPVFKSPMRLGSVIKPPVAPPAQDSNGSQANGEGQQRNLFGWNNVFKRLRKSLVTTQNEKTDKKVLALSNEAYAAPNVAPRQSDVFVVDTSRGEDITTFVNRDAGVVVTDVPVASSKSSESSVNVITSGYMYKNKYPETGHKNVWERYYFVLNRSDGSLSYYISDAHAKDRTFVRGTSRPLTVSEGLPMHVHGQHNVFGFQINTQGHGAFMVLVDSIDTRLTWLTEVLVCVSNANPSLPLPKQRLSLLPDDAPKQRLSGSMCSMGSLKCSKEEMKELVMEFYRNLFGPTLKFSSPLDAPASFWMEEKIDPVSEGCVLSSNLPACVPYWGEFHGYKRLCDYWKIRDETVERSSGRVLRVLVDEDEETAVVMTSTTFRILRNSEIITEESCDIVSMSAGSIVSIHCTFDSHRIAQAFEKEGISAS
uniref:PH domain-containing protein n=1 Tax=Hyaloperonospora arabidopsidis (strain Emoy2) TaxID=559515 RepID=M4C0N2_HYAAE